MSVWFGLVWRIERSRETVIKSIVTVKCSCKNRNFSCTPIFEKGKEWLIKMKHIPNGNNNIDKYSVMKEEKSSFVLIGIAVIMVIIMLIMSI